ncbi:hypothetical protein [Escherichia coli]|uniref:hypothetical protein n=2 Tax=Escherichia coli TaxID=562 RepID=UPI0009AF5E34|nr:hypothetical protein [Escherichia coli]MBD3044834.1 hypothetical protein [Escherichia coli]MBV4766501.1 hypothetical protein [Escherichia coli]MDZ9566119.1 hypothetical protein [Escherichia coli]OPI62296.1 hypothetical protein BFQ27_19525 [Escherichia coli]
MESNIKGLVAAGHEMASELKAECGAVDMRSVAKLISDLATQLEVQLVRANALAAENAVMLETIEAVRSVADNSSGISGWHLNGDIATWEEILPEINDIEPPATDAFLAEIERKAIHKFINSIEHILRDKLSPYDTEEMLEAMRIFLEEQEGEQK